VQGENTIAIEISGELWFTYYDESKTRDSVKRTGAKLYASDSLCSGEIVKQMWIDPNGNFWYGSDWYNDAVAKVYRAFYCPF